jgi:phosphoribosylformylglycinamidine cyclo-ligase
MLRTFNCGIGMIVVASPQEADAIVRAFAHAGETVMMLGNITRASGGVSVVYDGKLDLG